MFRSYFSRLWQSQKIYHTQVHQELWFSVLLTAIVFYKISYGGKKSVEANKKHSGH